MLREGKQHDQDLRLSGGARYFFPSKDIQQSLNCHLAGVSRKKFRHQIVDLLSYTPVLELSIHPPIHLSTHPLIHPSIHLSTHLSKHLSTHPSIHPSSRLFTHPSTHPSITAFLGTPPPHSMRWHCDSGTEPSAKDTGMNQTQLWSSWLQANVGTSEEAMGAGIGLPAMFFSSPVWATGSS